MQASDKLYPADYSEFMEQFKVDVPDNYNFAFDFLDKVAQEAPDTPAMIHIDPNGTRRDFTMGYFSSESSKLANALAKYGIKRGDRVMVILYRKVEFWVTLLALQKIGAVPVPSPNLLTPHDIEFRVNYAGIKGFVVDESVAERVEEARPKCPSMEVLVQSGGDRSLYGWILLESIIRMEDDDFTPEGGKPGGDDPLFIFFTSGTTGMPKMVEHTHNYPLGHFTTGAYWHNLEPGDIHLTLADSGWAKAVWGKFYGQWLAGGTVFTWDFRGRFEPAELLEVISRHGVNSFCAPPTVYRFLIREDISKYDLSALKHCTTAGELLNAGVFTQWKEITGLPIYEGYGQTETCLQIANFPFMEPKPSSIGKVCPGWDIVLLDREGKECPPGEEGEICIRVEEGRRPLGLFTGYLDEPDKTASVLFDGYYHTGDKAWIDEDGYFWFLGRTDDLIKSSGYRIGPFEVESALITHEAVVEAAVTGVPDDVRGQIVKATLVLAPGFEPSDELTKAIQDHVKKETAPYKYPRIVDYVKELPKTISGKIKRAEIRAKDE